MSTPLVRSRYHMSLRKMRILELSLNRPESLNALTLEMIRQLRTVLDHAAEDTSVDMVVLRGEGDRAFCAGGDVIGMAQMQGTGQAEGLTHLFFELEYQLDHLLHTYPKPVIGIGHGWIMGGGMGLLQGCSHRVITRNSRMAMPETLIGLFPDVGAGWFLNRLSGAGGRFLALTGMTITAEDACMLSLADVCIDEGRVEELMQSLIELNGADWQSRIDVLLEDFAAHEASVQSGELCRLHDQIQELEALPLDEFCEFLPKLGKTDPWLAKAADNLAAASPLSVSLTDHHLKRSRVYSLEQVFEHELSLACRCVMQGDFVEGVRARLIDKDFAPRWRYSYEALDTELLSGFLMPYSPY